MNRRAESDAGAYQASLSIETPLGHLLGASRIRLLEAIALHGSIARAAKAVGLGYKAAWEAVDDMNNLATEALVVRTSGGARGGGTRLTPYATRLIAFYRALEAEHQGALQRLQQTLQGAEPADLGTFRRMLRRFSMQSSAGNQFAGTVVAVQCDAVEAQVRLALGPDLTLAAVVTAESVARMGLVPGVEVHALVKSSSVMLALPGVGELSARNRYAACVLRVVRGQVNTEVTVQLAGAHALQLAAVITDDSAQRLALEPGREVDAFFKASSVLLAVTG